MLKIHWLGGVAMAAVALQAQAAVVYQDSFASNSLAHLTISGANSSTWAVADGKLQSALTQTPHNPTVPGFAAIQGVSTAQHFKIEGDVQVVGLTPGHAGDWGHVGFFWGMSDPGTYSIGYLRTHLDHVTAWKSAFTSELITGVNGNAANAVDLQGSSYHLAFEVDYGQQTMTVSLDGASQTFGPADFGVANAPGGVGGALGMISWGEHVSYDNVQVTNFTASAVPEPASLALMLPGLAALAWGWRRRQA